MDLSYYQALVLQSARLDAFQRALAATVRPGDRVLDIGTGLGTYALLSARAGAGEVWAVEPAPVVHVAEDLARTNAIDQVRYVRGRMPDATVPAPVDVIVYEDFSPRLLDPASWALFQSLHGRWVGPRTRFVPTRAEMVAAPAAVAGLLQVPEGASGHGLRWDVLRPYLANLPQYDRADPSLLLAPPAVLFSLDLAQAPAGWSLEGTAQFTVERAGPMTSLAVWHRLELAPGIVLDNAPGASPASWGHLVLPLDPPLDLAAGDDVAVRVAWDPDAFGAPSWLAWSAAVAGRTVRGHELAGFPASRADLVGSTPEARPHATREGAMVGVILALADGARTVDEIARELGKQYPAMDEAALVAAVIGQVGQGVLTVTRETP